MPDAAARHAPIVHGRTAWFRRRVMEGIGPAGPMDAPGSAGRRGDFPPAEPYRAQDVAARATPAITRVTTAQLGKTSSLWKTAR